MLADPPHSLARTAACWLMVRVPRARARARGGVITRNQAAAPSSALCILDARSTFLGVQPSADQLLGILAAPLERPSWASAAGSAPRPTSRFPRGRAQPTASTMSTACRIGPSRRSRNAADAFVASERLSWWAARWLPFPCCRCWPHPWARLLGWTDSIGSGRRACPRCFRLCLRSHRCHRRHRRRGHPRTVSIRTRSPTFV